jgi:hypothetical protein
LTISLLVKPQLETWLSRYPSTHFSTCPSIHPPIHLLPPPTHLPIYPSNHPPTHLSTHPPIHQLHSHTHSHI